MLINSREAYVLLWYKEASGDQHLFKADLSLYFPVTLGRSPLIRKERVWGAIKLCIHLPSVVQLPSPVRLFATPWTAARQASLSITKSRSLLKLMSIESVVPSNHLNLCHSLLLLPSIFPSLRVFSKESIHLIRQKYWTFSFSICPSNEYSGLISFRIDWLDLLAVQGTLKSLLQYHSSKASILQCLAFFIVQLHIHIRLLEKP